jgi:prevent-host-death family protein
MTTISKKELHERTGHWLKQVAEAGEIVVVENGRPLVRILPPEEQCLGKPFLRRRMSVKTAKLINRPISQPDSSRIISEGRDNR